ncbi:MAG TPA: carotenoid biosynthesis protein [Prolixibacteraceae bacterium]
MGIMSKYLLRQKLKTIILFVLFYALGVAGIGLPFTQHLFITLIPFVLLMSFVAILLFHNSLHNENTRLVFFTIIFIGYIVEVAGVNSQLIFGKYLYGSGLGFKLFNTPLMIGINWAMLVYCSASIMERVKIPAILQVILASVLIVLYDIVLEQVAPFLDMWYWNGNTAPFQNYVVWFVLALIFHGLVKLKKVKTVNPLASAIFVCQFFFYVAILLFIK